VAGSAPVTRHPIPRATLAATAIIVVFAARSEGVMALT
jgi:hypothetical protein